jgi:asparagine synthase (glutamine-hydrolysing)
LIGCSAFCLPLSDRAARKAFEAASTIDRIGSRTPIACELGATNIAKRASLIALALNHGKTLPVVHGYIGQSETSGEYSLIEGRGGNLVAVRDFAGTRPLYVGESGEWIASDHRFLRGEGRRLLPPCARYDVATGRIETVTRRLHDYGGSFGEAARELADLIDGAVRDRVRGRRRVAVAFSGGLDSSILAHCASKYAEVIACTVRTVGSFDEAKAAHAARKLDVELRADTMDRVGVVKELSLLDLPFEPGGMDKSLWCIYSVAARTAARCGAEVIVLGQLADELFGGYLKYRRAAEEAGQGAAQALMEKDVAECGMRGLIRDEAACSRWLEPRFPFAERSIVEFGLANPVSYKLRNGNGKMLLREAAKLMGLPDELSDAPKKAAQYSSGILKLVD